MIELFLLGAVLSIVGGGGSVVAGFGSSGTVHTILEGFVSKEKKEESSHGFTRWNINFVQIPSTLSREE
jgi:hypothetical protein